MINLKRLKIDRLRLDGLQSLKTEFSGDFLDSLCLKIQISIQNESNVYLNLKQLRQILSDESFLENLGENFHLSNIVIESII